MAEDTKSIRQFPIVGIGASAGGLEVLQRFLAALPADFGFALVFIQHLSAKHKSLLQELLSARRPSLVIQQISDGLKIEPGRLYLAPPGKEVRLRNGLFQTTVHPEGLIHLPIDEFLSSLAEDAGERSLAVIFSGAGTDGARGCQTVRAAGGTVYVQDPQTAEFDSMPLAAIATGQPDAVLPPEDIAAELLKLQGLGETAVHREYPITPEEYGDFFRILQEKTGSRFNYYKKSVVSRRIKRRMYLHGLSSVKEYQDLISASDPEAVLLASDLMIGVTSFFRDRVAWKALNVEAVRKITAENTDLPVRVWTPASATGEEAYSIAMMLLHELALAEKKRDVQVFATDVNERALERAREGKYPASITADVSQEYVQKYFTPVDDGNFLVINKDVRECVVFAKQDLLTDPPFSKLDLILCRNFLIYLEPEAQEKSITLFHYALREGGYLFLGNAETIGRKSALFKSIGHKQCRVYRKLETKPASRLPISVPYATKRQAPSAKGPMTEQSRSAMEIVQEKLLEEYGPAAVAIDQNYEIIYHNGPTNRYLHQPRGVPTQNLLELVPENLRSRIRGALYRSGREERPVVIRTSVAGDDNKTRHVTLRIMKAAENLSIVVFQEKSAPSKGEAAEQVDAAVIEETAIHQLESELSATRADLQSHIEQLKSMNEEFQSSNEELQAANEELETSREELQSLNEELITVNSQLQGKIEEQDITNNDLNNFLASTNIPTVFLDTHFRVKRFTPAMLKLIKLLPSDVGRHIVDMSQENLGPDLTSDAQTVLDSLVPIRKELAVDGVWYIRTTQPYRTSDSRIEGVVITYTDITERKRDEEIKSHLSAIIESADEAIMSKDLNGMIQTWNAGAEKIFGYAAQEAIGRNISFLVPPGHVDEVPEILKRIATGEHVEHFETVRMKKDGTIIPVSLTYSPIRNANGRVIGVSKISHDISERKKAEERIKHLASFPQLNPNPVCEVEPAGNVTFCNPAAFKILTDLGMDSRDVALFLPLDTEEILKELEKKNEAILYREVSIKDRIFGETIHLAPQFNVVRIYAFDITERKRAEDALRKSEELFRLAMDSMPDAIAIYDDERRYEFVNAAGLRRVGKPLASLVGRRIDEMYDEKTRSAFWPALMRAYETGETQTTETTLTMTTGQYDLILTFVPMLKDGRVSRVLSFTFDITERKRAERALQESEQRLKLFIEHAPASLAMFDREMRYLNVSRRWMNDYGLGDRDLRGLSHYDVFPEIPERWKEIHRRALAGEVVRDDNDRFDRLDGSVQWLRWEVRPWLDAAGYIAGIVVFSEDITEYRRAEEALKANEQQFRTLADSIPNLTWWANADGYITWYNQRWYEYTGKTPEQMEGWGWQSVHDPEVLPKVLERWKASIATGEPFEMEFPLRGADGVFRSFLTRVMPLKDSAGLVVRWFGTNTDISALKQAEESLRGSEARYRGLFENLTEGFAYCKMIFENGKPQDFMYLAVNQAFETLTGLKNVVGKRVTEVIPGIREADQELFEIYGRVSLTGKPERFETFVEALKMWFSISVYSPEKEFFVAVFDVITERKKTEADILKLSEDMAARNTELETANKEMESFIYSVSHDLRAPIRTMSGFAKILHEDFAGKLDATGQDYLNRILRGSEKSTQLIDDLLHLSKISRQEMDRIETNLSSKASKIVEQLREMNPDRQIEVVVQEGMKASADPRLIELALTNLLSNAWKFTSKAEKARIEFGAMDSLLRISDCGLRNETTTEMVKQGKTVYFIRDNGAGFDMTYAGKMFWPFHRLHTDKEFEGTGIGLTIVERIVHRHGGKVWAEGEVGKGAVFYFTL